MCPVWAGQPITEHWSTADPAAFVASEEAKRRVFLHVYRELENRGKIFTSLSLEMLDRFALEERVKEIGKIGLPDESDS
jgi:arsenate reductase